MAVSDADILAYVQANINDPGAIASAAQQYGVSLDDLTRATGYNANEVNNYFQQANVSPYWSQPVAPEPQPEPQPTFGSNVGDFGVHDYYSNNYEDIPNFRTQNYQPEPQPQYQPPQPQPIPEPAYTAPPQPVYSAPQAAPQPTTMAAPVAPAQSLVQQILGQGTTSKWTGEGFGSAEKNAEDMAKILSGIGITDISQFGKITKEVPASSYETESGTVEIPASTYTTYGNKLTGQEVPNTYGERQTGDAFGGTYAGKGNTGYRVQFDEKGNPYFYTSGQSSSDAGQWMPIVQLALAATGAGGLLGNALLGAGAGAVATNALGNAIISGALTGATGGNVLKGALLGGAGGALGGYLQESGMLGSTGGNTTTSPTGGIDGANINFNDLAETGVIDSLKAQGLSNQQISQWLENASAADLGYTPPADVISGAGVDFADLADNALIDSLKAQGLTNQQISQFIENAGGVTGPVTPLPDAGTVTVTGAGATTPSVVPSMVSPDVLAAVTAQLNNSLNTQVPTVEVTGDKVTKTTTTDNNATVPTVTVTGNLPVNTQTPEVVVTGDKPVKPDDTTPEVVITDNKPVKPVVPEVPEVVITGDKPVTPVTPEVVITDTKPPIITEPPPPPPPPPETLVVNPPVIVPPIVLPPPPPPPPPVVTPPPVVIPPTVMGRGLNPGMMETTPFYNTTNDAQAKYYWGDHGFQSGPTFNAAAYNAVAAPATPWGAQGVAQPLTAADYENIILGRPFQQEQFTPATRVQAYNPALLQTAQGQITVGTPVTGPSVPGATTPITTAEVQQVASVLGNDTAQRLAQALAAGDMDTVNNIKSQFEYVMLQQQYQGGGE